MPFYICKILKGGLTISICAVIAISFNCVYLYYIYIHTSHRYNIFMSFVYTRFRMGLPPLPPLL